MKHKLTTILLFCFILSITSFTADKNSSSNNPLLGKFNEIIQFADLTAEKIKEATDISIKEARESLAKLYAITKEQRTFDNTLLELDNIYNKAGNIYGIVYLMGGTHPDDLTRNQADESKAEFAKFFNEISLDENLYRAVKDYSETAEAKSLTGYKARFVEKTVEDFERNGFALPKEKRDELKVINDKLSDLGILFQKNIAEVSDYLIVDESEIDGLQEDYKNSRRQEDGKYKIDLTYPSYIPFMKFSNSESARKKLYTLYNNRAAAKNPEVLIKY